MASQPCPQSARGVETQDREAGSKSRTPTFGANTVVALRFCWAVLGAPTGKRLAPMMGELVSTPRRFGELERLYRVAIALVTARRWLIASSMSGAYRPSPSRPGRRALRAHFQKSTNPLYAGTFEESTRCLAVFRQWGHSVATVG